MEFLKSIHIKGYKCFVDNSFNLRPLTILAGINSVGKSSLIQSILLFRSFIEKLKFEEKPLIELNKQFGLMLGNFSQIHSKKAQGNSIMFSFNQDYENKFFVQFHPGQETLIEKDYDLNSLVLNPVELSKKQILQNTIFGKKEFYYLYAERLGPRNVYHLEHLSYPHSGWQGEFALQICSDIHIKRMKVDSQKVFFDSKITTFEKQLNEWMNYIIPNIDIQSKIYNNINQIEAAINSSSPFNVGFGISYVLPVVVNGLLAQQNTLYIVENPEAHLHPLGQSRIGYFLAKVASAGVQVIVETHSEHVINGIRLAYMKDVLDKDDIIIHFLEKDENQEIKDTIIEILETGDLTKFPKGFLDQTQKDLAELTKFKIQKNKNK